MKVRALTCLLFVAFVTAAQSPAVVRGKVVNLAPELHLVGYTIRLVSADAEFQTSLKPDQSFEFVRVPPGEYHAVLGAQQPHSAFPGAARSNVFRVTNTNISDVVLDMRNNPFPELPGGSFLPASNWITLQGVMTTAIADIRQPAKLQSFRMEVRDAVSGNVVPWAIVMSSSLPPQRLMTDWKLSIGGPVTVVGAAFTDGSHRLLIPQGGSINGTVVPRAN
jgi:hypothetical protein